MESYTYYCTRRCYFELVGTCKDNASYNSKPKSRVYSQLKTGFLVLKNTGLPGFSVSAKTGLETIDRGRHRTCLTTLQLKQANDTVATLMERMTRLQRETSHLCYSAIINCVSLCLTVFY